MTQRSTLSQAIGLIGWLSCSLQQLSARQRPSMPAPSMPSWSGPPGLHLRPPLVPSGPFSIYLWALLRGWRGGSELPATYELRSRSSLFSCVQTHCSPGCSLPGETEHSPSQRCCFYWPSLRSLSWCSGASVGWPAFSCFPISSGFALHLRSHGQCGRAIQTSCNGQPTLDAYPFHRVDAPRQAGLCRSFQTLNVRLPSATGRGKPCNACKIIRKRHRINARELGAERSGGSNGHGE